MAEALESPMTLPKSELKAINSMAEKFKNLTKGIDMAPEKPAAIAPVEPVQPAVPETPKPQPTPATPEKPAAPATPAPAPAATPESPTLPPEVKGNARKAFETLEQLKNKYQKDFETLKPQLDATAAEKVALAAERDALKAQYEVAKKATADYETLKQQHEAYDKIIKQFYIENDPQFQAHYGQKIQTSKLEAEEAARLAGEEVVAKVKSALEIPASPFRDQQVASITGELDDYSRVALVNAYTELKRTERERAAELAKAPENHQKLQEVRAKQAQEQAQQDAVKMTATRTRLLDMAQKQVEAELNGFADAESVRGALKKVIFNEATSDEYVGVLADAARWRRHQSTMKEKDELIGKLQTQLNEIQAATPGVRASTTSTERKTRPPLDNSDLGPTFRRLTSGK
jgi:hypothetical protein